MGLILADTSIVFFDTAPFIYFFERNRKFFPKITSVLDEIHNAGAQITTSLITCIEITTVPAKAGDTKAVAKYRDYFTNSENLSIQSLNLTIAEETVRFRANYGFKTPDAIQLATAVYCGADYVITNDRAWRKVEELDIITLEDLEA